MAGMTTKSFPKVNNANRQAARSMRSAFGGTEEAPDKTVETPSAGHTKLDEDQDSFAGRMSASIKRRQGG